jgi:hypothetical protein
MNEKMEKKDTVTALKNLIARKGVDAPRVTADSAQERRWFPSFIVSE